MGVGRDPRLSVGEALRRVVIDPQHGKIHRLGSPQFSTSWRGFARQLLTIGENRLELLTVEAQEGRERLVLVFLMALGVAVFGLMATLTLTAAIVVWLWPYSAMWPLS